MLSFSVGERLTHLVDLFVGDELPPVAIQLFFGASLCALKKKDGRIRPIAIGSRRTFPPNTTGLMYALRNRSCRECTSLFCHKQFRVLYCAEVGLPKRLQLSTKDLTYGLLIDQSGPPFTVCHVDVDGAAYNAGVRAGDRVLKVGDQDFLQYVPTSSTCHDEHEPSALISCGTSFQKINERNSPEFQVEDVNLCTNRNGCAVFPLQHPFPQTSTADTSLNVNGNIRRRVQFVNIDDIGVLFDCERDSEKVFIVSVKTNYAGWYAGLHAGDIVVCLNGVEINGENILKTVGSAERIKKFDLTILTTKQRMNRKLRGERLCKLILPQDSSVSYGFSLGYLSNGEHVIESVEANSNAFIAGLRPGDRLVEIDGINVEARTHAFVVDKIKAAMKDKSAHGLLTLLVTTQSMSKPTRPTASLIIKGYTSYREQVPQIIEPLTESEPNEFATQFGFDFYTTYDNQHVVSQVVDGYALSLVGLRIDDRILEINGVNTECYSNAELRILLHHLDCEQLVLVVANEPNYRAVKQKFPITTKRFLSYGSSKFKNDERKSFSEENEHTCGIEVETSQKDNRFIHWIKSVSPGSLAENVDVGIRDRIVQVTNVDVSKLDNGSVVDLINKKYRENRLTMVLSSANKTFIANTVTPFNTQPSLGLIPRKITIPQTEADSFDFDCISDSASSYSYFTRINKESRLAKSGIVVGDKLISINGIDLRGLDKCQIKAYLKSDSDTIGVLVEHTVDSNFSYDRFKTVNIQSTLKDQSVNNKSKSMIDVSTVQHGIENDDNDNGDGKEQEERKASFVEFANTYHYDVYLGKYSIDLGMSVKRYECGLFLIDNVIADSPAWKAGLRENDVLIQINDIPIQQYHTNQFVSSLLKKFSTNDPVVSLIVKRSRYIKNVPKFSSTPDLSAVNNVEKNRLEKPQDRTFAATDPIEPVPRRCTLRLQGESTDWGFRVRPAPSADCPVVYACHS
ncbi:hypothetical protein ACOME3_009788 [Neoechinorhynchus agilis]